MAFEKRGRLLTGRLGKSRVSYWHTIGVMHKDDASRYSCGTAIMSFMELWFFERRVEVLYLYSLGERRTFLEM